jgi:phosphomannomutase
VAHFSHLPAVLSPVDPALMAQRILSISGLRGVIGDGLDPAFLTEFAAAVGTLAGGGAVVLSRDGRSTGVTAKHAALAGLLATGCRVLDADIAATPTCGVLVTHLAARGGLQLTASHNPVEWNGMKPFSPIGGVLNQSEGETLVRLLNERKFAWKPWNGLGVLETIPDPSRVHLDKILPEVRPDKIRGRRFKVVLDCNHGSGAVFGPRLLETLGCQVTVLGGTPDGAFEHVPEPLEQNLRGLCEAVRREGADVGFAQDPDADRLAIVDNTGRYIGEELTLALCADVLLPRRKGPIVVNGSTSRVSADLAEKYGCAFHRSHVGEANVVTKMREVGAVVGGEGNGGLIDPRIGFVRDSFASMAYVLDGLVDRSGTLADWVDSLPKYAIVKDKVTCAATAVEPVCRALLARYAEARATTGDGLRLDWDDRWVQVRASNTEPIVRVISEAPNEPAARALCDAALALVREVAGT